MKSKTKNKLLAFLKEAIRAAIAAVMGVAGATLSQEIRDAVSGITPASLGAAAANGIVKISSVMDLASETYRLIDGLNEFRIVGIDLTVPDGEDESLVLVAADGTTKAADITVVSTEDGQRIVCTLASAVPARASPAARRSGSPSSRP